MTRYPTRARIIDVTGKSIEGIGALNTPDVSKPHIGKEGLAEEVKVPLDHEEQDYFWHTGRLMVSEGLITEEQLNERIAVLIEQGQTQVRITLDDGTIIWGYECWWEPIQGSKEVPNGS